MNDGMIIAIYSFIAVGALSAIVILLFWIIDGRRDKFCEHCGQPLRRGPWQIVGYSGLTGKPAVHRRWTWCETPYPEYVPPRPRPMPLEGEIGRGHIDVPDDPTFKNSHHYFTETRRGR